MLVPSWPESAVRYARNSSPETGLLAANLRKRRHFREYPKSLRRDPGGWLGISDSNLEMSESKSSWFAWVISVHFEKVRRFGPFLKRLAVISECRAMVTAYQRHTRPSFRLWTRFKLGLARLATAMHMGWLGRAPLR
jgi:hypothetical protein